MKKILLRTPANIANIGPGYDIFAMALREPHDEIKITLDESKKINIEIIGDEITISEKFSSLGYSMRFPVFQRLRLDKGKKEITTVKEIKDLYENQ